MTHTHVRAPTQLEANEIRSACRRFGQETGIPLVFLQHFRRRIDHWDPAGTDGFARDRPVILFDNAGVAGSTGKTPDRIDTMADHASPFVRSLELSQADLLGFSNRSFVCNTTNTTGAPIAL